MDCCEHDMLVKQAHKKGAHVHDGGNVGMDHGSAKDFLRRFFVVTILLIPLFLTNSMVAGFLGIPTLHAGMWIQFGITTIIFCFSIVFFQHARHEIMARKYGMMTLVSLALGSGYAFSVASTFVPSLHTEFYLEIATLVWVLLFGHYLEARSSSSAGDALQEVAKLLPKQAHKTENGIEVDVAIETLREGDMVLVKSGEKVPADGIIASGHSHMNESLVSGESKPVEREEGERVVAGSIALDGSLTVRLTRVGEHSTIGQIQKLIATAQKTKPSSQRIADKASAVLTFVALSVALLTLGGWWLLGGHTFVFALTLAITVLVIACPHALGLAIPTVTTIATSLAVRSGIFIKNLAKIETIRKATYVVFDKTGTLTSGVFGVVSVTPVSGFSAEDVVRVAASLDRHSSHIIGQSINTYAELQSISTVTVTDFKNNPGRGVQGKIDGAVCAAGNKSFMAELGLTVTEDTTKGATVVFVVKGAQVIGSIALADATKPESKKTIDALHMLGIRVALLTGDSTEVAEGVARELGIDTYFAEVFPEDKYTYIKHLQEKGNIVLMVGDGINDAPALTQSDVGIAVGAGTDVAVDAGDVVLMRSNPEDVVRLITLAKKVYTKMIQNLLWALGYNTIAIPAAAGVFAAWGFYLRPEIGALLMSASTVIVVVNALSLRRLHLEHAL